MVTFERETISGLGSLSIKTKLPEKLETVHFLWKASEQTWKFSRIIAPALAQDSKLNRELPENKLMPVIHSHYLGPQAWARMTSFITSAEVTVFTRSSQLNLSMSTHIYILVPTLFVVNLCARLYATSLVFSSISCHNLQGDICVRSFELIENMHW